MHLSNRQKGVVAKLVDAFPCRSMHVFIDNDDWKLYLRTSAKRLFHQHSQIPHRNARILIPLDSTEGRHVGMGLDYAHGLIKGCAFRHTDGLNLNIFRSNPVQLLNH